MILIINLPNIVCIGGGNGLSVVLRGLKIHKAHITAIVAVTDDGGSSGRLRHDMKMPPPGDIRNVMMALSEREPMLTELMQYRFQSGEGLAGHTIGNLLIAAMKDITGNFTQGIKELSRVFAVKGEVLPASEQDIQLSAELMDGSIVHGESQIPKADQKINKVFLTPHNPLPVEDTLKAIQKANLIVIGPGSLYTSILPSLLIPEIANAIKASTAKKIYICNIMTQPGETNNFSASDHLRVISEHVGKGLIDIAIINNEIPTNSILRSYLSKNQSLVSADIDNFKKLDCDVIGEKLISYYNSYNKIIRHNPVKVSELIMNII